MANKDKIGTCLNCIHVNKQKTSEPCIYCKYGIYDMGFARTDKFVQRGGMSVKIVKKAYKQ